MRSDVGKTLRNINNWGPMSFGPLGNNKALKKKIHQMRVMKIKLLPQAFEDIHSLVENSLRRIHVSSAGPPLGA